MRYTPKGTYYVNSKADLDQYRNEIKSVPCPHCGAVGYLICHGYVMGYGQTGAERMVRGGRFFCSNRYRRKGCGRTFSVLLADFMHRRIVPASTLWDFLKGVRGGLSRHAAWYKVGSPFSIQTGYRLWGEVKRQQPRIRAMLSRLKPPPETSSSEPIFQMLEHLRSIFPDTHCPITAFHLRFQCSFLC
jgi:hypothetical protein